MGRKASRSRSPAKSPGRSSALNTAGKIAPKSPRRARESIQPSRKSPRASRTGTSDEQIQFHSLDLNSSSRKAKPNKSLWTSIIKDLVASRGDIWDTIVFLVTVVLTGKWTNLFEISLRQISPGTDFSSFKTPITLLWVYITCVLCCICLRPGSFNPWAVFDSKLSVQRKTARIVVQLATAVGFALVVSSLDAFAHTGFDRAFVGKLHPAQPIEFY